MNKFYKVNYVLLTLLSFNTALVKLFSMQAEMDLFHKVGFSDNGIYAFGVFQLVGAILLVIPRLGRYGALLMGLSFIAATSILFLAGMNTFGAFSLLFIASAAWPVVRSLKNCDKAARPSIA
jgi:hypothetical protein